MVETTTPQRTPAETKTEPAREASSRKERWTWTREAYIAAAENGIFGPDERLELIGGEVYRKMSPQASPHAAGVRALEEAMRAAFGDGYDVRAQLPLDVGEESLPEPDLCVVSGNWRDFVQAHPKESLLVAEVADTSLRFDRTTKAGLYARAGVPEYWILNLTDRVLEVHREPAAMADQPFGHHYRSITRHTEADEVSPLSAPEAKIAVRDLLP